MIDINNIYKPKAHPQISAPFKFVTSELNNTHHPYEVAGVKVDDLKPTQPFVDNDLVDLLVKKLVAGDTLKPIWIDKDDNILDGHHRYAAHLVAKPDAAITAVRLLCNKKTGMELLCTIQEEFVKHKQRFDQSELLRSLSEADDSMYIRDKDHKTTKETVVGYRKNPITKSMSGNFFVLKAVSGYKAFEIEFDSLFHTDELDKKIGTSANPIQALCLVWFPTIDIKGRAKDFGMTPDNFVNAIVAEKARTKRIDGIKYGEKLLQTIDEK
jgi:hypothetical protein